MNIEYSTLARITLALNINASCASWPLLPSPASGYTRRYPPSALVLRETRRGRPQLLDAASERDSGHEASDIADGPGRIRFTTAASSQARILHSYSASLATPFPSSTSSSLQYHPTFLAQPALNLSPSSLRLASLPPCPSERLVPANVSPVITIIILAASLV